jgi:hypothetical protein
MPEGHAAEQVGVAVNGDVVPPALTAPVVGTTATDVRVGGGVEVTVMTTGELCTVALPSVALRKSPTVPIVFLAVNATGLLVDELRVPMEGVVRVQL